MTTNTLKTSNFMGWQFDTTYLKLPAPFYTKQLPQTVPQPKFLCLNEALANELGLNVEALSAEEGLSIFGGNTLPEGATPLAQAYAGHQYGHFTTLGDGRAVLLAEHLTPTGDRVDIQLKGSGRTPYSRGGDGKAAVAPMLREYLISEAMHALGIPTTRSLAVVSTGEWIQREKRLPGAVLTRVASSHIRVGTFEWAASRGDVSLLKALADYTINRHYKECQNSERPYLELLRSVMAKQAQLIAQWQLVGFVHGVMNTDNMALSGETIDYGPCAFMDAYDLKTVFSSIDHYGRYAYGNQPSIGGWNLTRLAEALLPLIDENRQRAIELAQEVLETYQPLFKTYWLKGMRAKLGLLSEQEGDETLVESLLELMDHHKVDYTLTFRALSVEEDLSSRFQSDEAYDQWFQQWQERVKTQSGGLETGLKKMQQVNPCIIPRNYWVEQALTQAEGGEMSLFTELLSTLQSPFAYDKASKRFVEVPEMVKGYRTFCGT